MAVTGVSIHFVAALIEGAKARHCDATSLLRRAGIDPASLSTPTARVPAGAYASLMLGTAAALDDEFFGRDSRRMKVGSFAMLCHAAIACRNLHRALDRALRFYGLMLDDLEGRLVEQEDEWRITLRTPPRGAPSSLFAHENLLLFLHRLACWLVNRRIPVNSLGFAFPPAVHADEYRLVFGTAAQFDQPCSTLGFDGRFGALPVVRDAAALKEFLALAPENLFVRYRPTHGTALRVRRHLSALALQDWPSFAELARALGMSTSTLHRRLAGEDATFQTIKDQARKDRAMQLLKNSDRSIASIAEELGFAEPSAFYRAFRKWSGDAPGRHRAAVKAD